MKSHNNQKQVTMPMTYNGTTIGYLYWLDGPEGHPPQILYTREIPMYATGRELCEAILDGSFRSDREQRELGK